MGVCNCSMFCCTLLYVHSSIAIILMGKRELIALLNLSSWCLVMVGRLFLAVPRGCLQFVIVVFPDHTHLLFFTLMAIKKAGFKAKLMTGTYVLQSNRAKFNQYSVDPTCLLCGDDTEDMIHYLLKCRSLSKPCDQFTEKISSILIEYQGTKGQKEIFKDFGLLAE